MSEQLDLSKVPQPKYGDDVWFAMIFPDEIANLTRLHGAILKWVEVTDKEFHDFRQQAEKRRTPQWDDYGYDPIGDEAFMLLGTERVMLANLGVSIAACAENFIIRVCKARGVTCVNKKGKTDFSIACTSLGASLKIEISQLPGYIGNQRARMLGNCFKHTEGKRNDFFVEKFGGVVGEEIEYEKERWPSMIADTKTLLSEIIDKLGS
jgi:hypothetical protein